MHRRAALILSAVLAAAPAAAQDAALEAELPWRVRAEGFGSFSGLLVSPDGTRILTVSDKGHIAEARLQRDSAGRLEGVTLERIAPLLDPRGAPVERYAVDAEGLARTPAGGVFVSFEASHRVDAYPDPFGPADPLPVAAPFRALQNNSGLEAIFTDAEGRLHALPERSGALDRAFPVWRLDGDDWTEAFSIPRRPPHLPVGADVGPDGRLYLLERHFAGLRGFQTRVRSFRLWPEGVTDERVHLDSSHGRFDNLEGIAAWEGPDGRVRLLMISDDNASIFQRTQLVEISLAGRPPPRPRPRPRASSSG